MPPKLAHAAGRSKIDEETKEGKRWLDLYNACHEWILANLADFNSEQRTEAFQHRERFCSKAKYHSLPSCSFGRNLKSNITPIGVAIAVAVFGELPVKKLSYYQQFSDKWDVTDPDFWKKVEELSPTVEKVETATPQKRSATPGNRRMGKRPKSISSNPAIPAKSEPGAKNEAPGLKSDTDSVFSAGHDTLSGADLDTPPNSARPQSQLAEPERFAGTDFASTTPVRKSAFPSIRATPTSSAETSTNDGTDLKNQVVTLPTLTNYTQRANTDGRLTKLEKLCEEQETEINRLRNDLALLTTKLARILDRHETGLSDVSVCATQAATRLMDSDVTDRQLADIETKFPAADIYEELDVPKPIEE